MDKCNHKFIVVNRTESINQEIIQYRCHKCGKRYTERYDVFSKVRKFQ